MSKTYEEIITTQDLNSLTHLEYCIWYTAVGANKYHSQQAAAELAALTAELERVKREMDELLINDAQSVDEFNAGYQAYENNMDLDTAEQMYYSVLPDNVPHYDSFSSGYAWAKFVIERAAALKEGKA